MHWTNGDRCLCRKLVEVRARPFTVDGVSGAGVGGASIRMKLANASISEITAGLELERPAEAVVKLSVSSGVALNRHPAV